MKITRTVQDLSKGARGGVLTIGNFDGVHSGHQAVLKQVQSLADSESRPALVMLFEPQPREFFQGAAAPPRIMPLRCKLNALAELGVAHVLCVRFDKNFQAQSAESFVRTWLVEGLEIRHLVIGDDFRFGSDRRGDFAMLQHAGAQHGFEVHRTHTHTQEGERVSSSRIRALLQAGRFCAAERLLTRPFTLGGRVVRGQQLGRTIGVPTANLRLKQLPPVAGVYIVKLTAPEGLQGLEGVANVGRRPTLGGQEQRLEVHLFSFSGDLYGRRIAVRFLHRLRDEIRFADFAALQDQIKLDLQTARAWLASPTPH